jgi:hypothetical protein
VSSIVLGLGAPHTPLLTFGPRLWVERAKDDVRMQDLCMSDGRTLTYQQLEAERGPRFAAQASLEVFEQQSARLQHNLDRLADELAAAAPDAVVIVGDDQRELFAAGTTPAVALYLGEEIVMHPLTEVHPDLPQWHQICAEGYLMNAPHRLPTAPKIAEALVESMIDLGVDVAVATQGDDPKSSGFGHAFGFIAGRLFRGRDIPIIPLLLNTYYPPNVPSAARAYDIGLALREAIDALPVSARIAVIASGGLSHFVTDEALDRRVMGALATGDPGPLRSLPRQALRSGSSEILNWVLVAGALRCAPHAWGDYVPVYRTPAGTGVGVGFACWRTSEDDRRTTTRKG